MLATGPSAFNPASLLVTFDPQQVQCAAGLSARRSRGLAVAAGRREEDEDRHDEGKHGLRLWHRRHVTGGGRELTGDRHGAPEARQGTAL